MVLLDNLVDEVIASEPDKSYLRKESRISQIASNDLKKSAAIATFEQNNEKKSRFPNFFWLSTSFK